MKVELSDFEKDILKSLPEEVGWMTRSEYGDLTVHVTKPEKRFYGEWISQGSYDLPLINVFQHVKWSNTEPWEFKYQ